MTADTWLGVAGVAVGILGWVDARRQRSARGKAVIAAYKVIERTYGLLIGIKPFVLPLGPAHEAAVNNGLAAIDGCRAELKDL